jgi:hypothetical protein
MSKWIECLIGAEYRNACGRIQKPNGIDPNDAKHVASRGAISSVAFGLESYIQHCACTVFVTNRSVSDSRLCAEILTNWCYCAFATMGSLDSPVSQFLLGCDKKRVRYHLKRNSPAKMEPAFLAKITDIRRTIHAHPELGFEEYGTQKLVRDELLAAGVPEAAIRTCAKTGLVVDIIGTYGMTVVAFSVNSLDIRHGLNVQGTSWGRWRAAVAGNSRGHGRFAVD